MSLSDLMGHAGLSGYAIVGLIIFFVLFVAIVIRVFRPSRREELEHASRLPLDDERPQPPAPGGTP